VSDGPTPASRRFGRILIGVGIVIILIGVLRMNARALGGPPEHPGDFSSRRTDFQVRSKVHEGFPEFLLLAGTGFAIVLFGAYRARGSSD
jgi:hypothetical protein